MVVGPYKLYVAKRPLDLRFDSMIRPIVYPLAYNLAMFGGVQLVGANFVSFELRAMLVGKILVRVILYVTITYLMAMLISYNIVAYLGSVRRSSLNDLGFRTFI